MKRIDHSTALFFPFSTAQNIFLRECAFACVNEEKKVLHSNEISFTKKKIQKTSESAHRDAAHRDVSQEGNHENSLFTARGA